MINEPKNPKIRNIDTKRISFHSLNSLIEDGMQTKFLPQFVEEEPTSIMCPLDRRRIDVRRTRAKLAFTAYKLKWK